MRILLVDDSRAVASVIGARLTTIGHEVIVAENGEVAVARFRDARPDLLLMDIEMPVMNGFEAAERIRALEANEDCAWTPIIFLTASDTPENLVTAIEAGGDDFIAKSVPEVVLEAKMKAMARIASLRAELARANRRLASLANCDGLTGLYNRRHMDTRLDALWAQATRTGAPFGLLMLDVDNFKLYNDHYGHQAGDDCLRAIARILADVCEKANGAGLAQGAFAARYGGEEFSMILPSVSPDACARVAGAAVAAVRAVAIPHARNADLGVVTVSLGGTRTARAEGSLVPLFREADSKLYEAKRLGRNRAELG
ncbi:diguanylate cyclase domain-containing protein [Zoogloea sp.]|uniref:diguanylate cyclase domain-containing protein n=1 Tax=Zoogloea sp. TaxID=49181 RepID=UPI0035B2AA8D